MSGQFSRNKKINLRLDSELYDQAMGKASGYGGLSAVIRAMLRKFVKGQQNFDIEDLAEENMPASKPRPPRKKKK